MFCYVSVRVKNSVQNFYDDVGVIMLVVLYVIGDFWLLVVEVVFVIVISML